MDENFRQTLIQIEREHATQNTNRKNAEQNNEILYIQALRKILKNVHVVFLISDLNTYYEWMTMFPGLEAKCEVIYMDELSVEGYRQLTSEFFA